MGVSLMGMAKSRRVLAVGIAGLALLAGSTVGGPARAADAASCADVPLQAAGAATLSSCGSAGLHGGATGANEAHFAAGTPRVEASSEAQQPRGNAHFGRSGRSSATGTGATAASVSELPARKTIDLSKLPAGLVSPDR